MPRIYHEVEIEIGLDEFTDDELVSEIEHRVKKKRQSKERNDFVRAVDAATRGNSYRANSLEDEIKNEMFERYRGTIGVNDLYKFLTGK